MRIPGSILLVSTLLLCGCPGGKQQDAHALIKKRGELIVAMDAGYDPFEVINKDGKITGFDVDLINEVAKDLGVKVKLKNVAWDGIIGELRTGKADVIFSGMSVTEERKKAVSFSQPYFEVGQVVVKRRGDDRIKSWKDLNADGMTIATQQVTTGEQAVRRLMPKAKVLTFAKADLACLAVVQQKADAVVFDHPFLMKYVAQRKEEDLEGIWEHFTTEPIAAACRKDSPLLIAAIDKTIARLTSSGELAKMKAKHFKGAQGAAAKTAAKTPAKTR